MLTSTTAEPMCYHQPTVPSTLAYPPYYPHAAPHYQPYSAAVHQHPHHHQHHHHHHSHHPHHRSDYAAAAATYAAPAPQAPQPPPASSGSIPHPVYPPNTSYSYAPAALPAPSVPLLPPPPPPPTTAVTSNASSAKRHAAKSSRPPRAARLYNANPTPPSQHNANANHHYHPHHHNSHTYRTSSSSRAHNNPSSNNTARESTSSISTTTTATTWSAGASTATTVDDTDNPAVGGLSDQALIAASATAIQRLQAASEESLNAAAAASTSPLGSPVSSVNAMSPVHSPPGMLTTSPTVASHMHATSVALGSTGGPLRRSATFAVAPRGGPHSHYHHNLQHPNSHLVRASPLTSASSSSSTMALTVFSPPGSNVTTSTASPAEPSPPPQQQSSVTLTGSQTPVASAMLTRRSSVPERLSPTHATFTSTAPPELSIPLYLSRLLRHAQCSPAVLPTLLVLLQRALASPSAPALTALTVHRLVAAAFLASVKMVDDRVYSLKFYAKVTGVSGVTELVRLERTFLQLVDFRLLVSQKEFDATVDVLKRVAALGVAREI